MSIFSKRLEQERKNAGWTKTYTASLLKLPLTTYANYEYGNREPDMAMIAKISTLFHTTTDYLLGKSDSPDLPDNSDNTTKEYVDLKEEPKVIAYGGKPISKEDMDIIKAILERHLNGGDN